MDEVTLRYKRLRNATITSSIESIINMLILVLMWYMGWHVCFTVFLIFLVMYFIISVLGFCIMDKKLEKAVEDKKANRMEGSKWKDQGEYRIWCKRQKKYKYRDASEQEPEPEGGD